MNKENIDKLWDDPRFQLLSEIARLLDKNKVWGGMEWTYLAIQPFQYRPLVIKIQTEIDKLANEFGVEQ